MSLPLRTAAQIWVFLFIVFLGAETVLAIPEARLAAQLLYAVPIIGLAAIRLTRAVDRLDAAVLGTTAVYAAVCFASPDRSASLETLGLATAFASLFIVMRQASTDARRWLAVATATSFAFNLVVQSVLWISEKLAWIGTGGGVPRLESFDVFVWASANAIPVMVLMGIGFAAWTPSGPVRRILWIVIGVTAIITVPLSVGRSGWLGLAVAASVAVVLFARADRRRLIGLGLAGAAVAAAAAVVAFAVVRQESIFRLLQGRDLVWSEAVATFAQNPVVGIGPGTYSWARLAADAPYADRLSVRLAHNVPLQTAVDGGIVLLVACAALLAVWVHRVWKRDSADVATRVSVAALSGYAAMSLFDDPSYLPSLTASAVVLAAWLAGPAARTSSRARLIAPAVVVAAALLVFPVVIANGSARTVARDARDAAVAGRWEAAAEQFGAAVHAYPTNASYRLGLGYSLVRAGALEAGRDAYLEAVRLSPGDPRGYGAVAALDRPGSGEWLDEAASRTIADPQYLTRLGDELLRQGDSTEATRAYARAVARDSRLYGRLRDQLGAEGSLRQAVIDVLGDGGIASASAESITWDMGLADDNLADDADPAWRAVSAARGGDERGALAMLEVAVAEAPHDPHTYRAILAVTRLTCADFSTIPNPEALLRLLVPAGSDGRVSVQWDQMYREPGLSDYQPVAPVVVAEWPWSLIDPVDQCEQP